jgi:hypothetical protein
MISAFARGAQVLGDERYLEAAGRAADFVMSRMYDPTDAALLRRFRDGEAAIPAFLDDYAFFVQGLLDLYEAGFDVRRLEAALELTELMVARFEDTAGGGFFATAAGQGTVILRLKDDYDGAEPSGNSIAILNLLRLGQMTGARAFRDVAEKALAAFAGRLIAAPIALPQMCAALEYARAAPIEVVLAGSKEASAPFLAELNRRYLPNKAVLLVNRESRELLERHAPQIAAMEELQGAATAYVCENFACRMPTNDPEEFAKLLDAPRGRGAGGS